VRIRDPIHGTITVTAEEKAVIDSPYFQRLRQVRQLGFGDMAFPGATHTRHAHSLGAMYVASRLFDAVASRSSLGPQARERFRSAVRLAVLCHDLGHMPLSHASESIAPMRADLRLPAWTGETGGQASHEDFTAKLLLDSTLTDVVRNAYGSLGITPELIAGLVIGRLPQSVDGFHDGGVDWTPLMRALVSGELDADRMDYLQRDSFFTGVNYGRYDIEWILQNLTFAEREGRAVLALSKAAVFAFEDFLLSRYHMFLSVYYHHTAVSFDWMLKRYYGDAPGEFEIPSDPQAFLGCDDVALWSTLRRSKNEWAQRITTRQGFRRVAQFTERDPDYELKAISSALTAASIEHFTVESRGVLSSYAAEGQTPSLYVLDTASGRLTEIAQYTPLYQRFAGAVQLSRVFVRPDQSARAGPVISQLTSGRPVALD
jgi:hypothetical protein